jgi:outer membrane protein TolC
MRPCPCSAQGPATPRGPLLLGLLVASASACRSAASWSADADREALALLDQQQEALGFGSEFSLERPEDTLRARLLSGSEGAVVLDFPTSLEVAAENSRDWQDQRESLFLTALALTRQRWEFSVQEGLSGEYSASGSGRSVERRGFLSQLNLFKLLGIGTRITAQAGLELFKDVSRGNVHAAMSHLQLNITQPILRGFAPEVVLEPLTQAERNLLYQARAYERFRRTFAVDVAQRYFRLLELQDRLGNEEANLANLVDLRKRNEALAEAGRQTDIQVDQARQNELSAEDRVVAARRDLEGALDDFKLQLGLPIEVALEVEEGDARSAEAWRILEAELDPEEVLAAGLASRLDHLTILDRVEDAERQARVAADALRLGLDLSASVGADSGFDRPADFSTDATGWSVGLGIDLPIDRIPERNAYRSALLDVDLARRRAEDSRDSVGAQLRDAVRRLESARASYVIQSGSVTLAERRVESAALNLEAGRADTRDVLEAQESLLGAQNSLAGALTDTILAGLSLYRDMERLEVTDAGILIEPLTAPSP